MKTGSSLALICVGAILAFAVTATPSFFNLHTAGWVIMLIGLIGLVVFNRNAAWLSRRRTVIRRSYPSGRVERIPVQSYVADTPGGTLPQGLPSRPTLLDQEDDLIEDGGPSAQPQPRPGTTEVIEDVYEQP